MCCVHHQDEGTVPTVDAAADGVRKTIYVPMIRAVGDMVAEETCAVTTTAGPHNLRVSKTSLMTRAARRAVGDISDLHCDDSCWSS